MIFSTDKVLHFSGSFNDSSLDATLILKVASSEEEICKRSQQVSHHQDSQKRKCQLLRHQCQEVIDERLQSFT